MRLLIIEDERKTASLLKETLGHHDCEAVCLHDGEAGLEAAVKPGWDALLVDIMLPKMDGIELVRELRVRGVTTPVIMISARGEVEQRVDGLDAGADDYLPKPFAFSELLARLRSLIRRSSQSPPTLFQVADLTFDRNRNETRRAGKRLDLSSRESLLLECLLRADGHAVTRRDILAAVWEYDFDPGSNLVEVYIRRLRDKIDRGHPIPLIQTLRGLGYALRTRP